MDPALVVVGAFIAFFVVLIGLVVRKMVRGQLRAPEEADRLEAGQTPEQAEQLAKEALGEIPPVTEEEAQAKPGEEAKKPAPMKAGLEKSRKGFMARINELLRGATLDESLADELESILVSSDIGIRTAQRLLGNLREQLTKKEITTPEIVR